MENIKNISIRNFLEQQEIIPQHDYRHYAMCRCPFREDRNASFKVDYRKNLWNGFGTLEGGSIIDLVIKMHNCTFNDAVRMLDSRANSCMYKHHNGVTSQQRTTIPIFLFTVIKLLKQNRLPTPD
jgi:DNA primase